MTEPNRNILDREFKQASSAELIRLICPVLREIVNYGTQLLARANESIQHTEQRLLTTAGSGHHRDRGQDHLIPLLLLYFSVLETTDATENGFANSIAVPLRPLVRSLFEIVVQMEWLYEKESVKRAYAYLVFELHQRLRFYEAVVPGNLVHNSLQTAQSTDRWTLMFPTPLVSNAQESIDKLRQLLRRPGYEQAKLEYDRVRPRQWYAMYDGPKGLEQLANNVRRGYQYSVLYRMLSSSAHGVNITARVTNTGSIDAMRSAAEMPMLAGLTIGFALDATHLFGDFFRPEEQKQRMGWYRDNISQRRCCINRIW
jgi:hypothetical protein